MKITDEAKKIMEEILVSNECDSLKVMIQKSCCGTSLYFTTTKLEEGDKPVTINGISVLMDKEVEERAEKVTLATENGKIIIQDEEASGSC